MGSLHPRPEGLGVNCSSYRVGGTKSSAALDIDFLHCNETVQDNPRDGRSSSASSDAISARAAMDTRKIDQDTATLERLSSLSGPVRPCPACPAR
jgi:hypothetical protein